MDQLRSPRLFEIDRKKTSKRDNFDDDPDKLCSKSFPVVSKRGTTYLFLWFCAAHGHCYGFHMIPGSEGRKDAANSLYCYLEKAPETIFYDFAKSGRQDILTTQDFFMTYFMDTLINAQKYLNQIAYLDMME